MGKGQRSREARAGKREELKKAAAKKKLHQKIKKIIGISVAGVVAVGLIGVVAYNTIASTGYFLRNTVAMKSDNFQVDNAMMTYFVKDQYFAFADQYGDSLSYFGLDSSKSLASQACGIQEGTWLDYFLSQTKETVKNDLLFAEKAKAEGMELDENDKKTIDETIASFKTAAETNKVTIKQFYSQVFGKGIKENDIRRALEFTALANKYNSKYQLSLKYTDEQYQTHFKENESSYIKADYVYVNVPGETEAEIKVNAKIFQSCKSVEEFNKLLRDLYTKTETKSVLEDEKLASEADLTDDQRKDIAEHVEEDMANAKGTAYKPAADAESVEAFQKWIFEAGRKVNDIYTQETPANEENKTSYSMKVYIVVKPTYFDDNILVKARHIMFTKDKYETLEKAKAKADEVLALYKAEPTTAKFEALVKEYSEDSNSIANGGLYEQITNDKDSWPFAEWCYAEGRKAGDVAVVQSSVGYHIVLHEGNGDIAWKAEAKQKMITADVEKHLEELGKAYAITQNDGKMKAVKA